MQELWLPTSHLPGSDPFLSSQRGCWDMPGHAAAARALSARQGMGKNRDTCGSFLFLNFCNHLQLRFKAKMSEAMCLI